MRENEVSVRGHKAYPTDPEHCKSDESNSGDEYFSNLVYQTASLPTITHSEANRPGQSPEILRKPTNAMPVMQ